jgi:hypothetical protein
MVTRIEFDFHTVATPDQVVGLLTDFSPDRPKIWPQLSERWFEVYSVGETSADVREGQDRPTLWGPGYMRLVDPWKRHLEREGEQRPGARELRPEPNPFGASATMVA